MVPWLVVFDYFLDVIFTKRIYLGKRLFSFPFSFFTLDI